MQMRSRKCKDTTELLTYTHKTVTNFPYFNRTTAWPRPLGANYAPVTGPSIANWRWAGLMQIALQWCWVRLVHAEQPARRLSPNSIVCSSSNLNYDKTACNSKRKNHIPGVCFIKMSFCWALFLFYCNISNGFGVSTNRHDVRGNKIEMSLFVSWKLDNISTFTGKCFSGLFMVCCWLSILTKASLKCFVMRCAITILGAARAYLLIDVYVRCCNIHAGSSW